MCSTKERTQGYCEMFQTLMQLKHRKNGARGSHVTASPKPPTASKKYRADCSG